MLVTTALRGREADRGRTGAGRQPAVAADGCDHETKDCGLTMPSMKSPELPLQQLLVDCRKPTSKVTITSAPPNSPMRSASTVSSGSTEHRREQPRQDQEVDTGRAEGRDRVYFLVDFLCADLGCERGPGASGEHDRRHQHAELAQHGDLHAIDDEDHRTELPAHEFDLEGDDHAHEETRQQYDRHRIGAGLRGDVEHIAPVDRASPRQKLSERTGARAQEPTICFA